MERYQIMTYTFNDGYNVWPDTYPSLKTAISMAQSNCTEKGCDGATVYDIKTDTFKKTIGHFPRLHTISEIKEAISSGKIVYDESCFTVKFQHGHRLGGVTAKGEDSLAEIIFRCLLRNDFYNVNADF